MFVRKIIEAGGTVEVEEYHTNRIGQHDRRAKRKNMTPEQVRQAYIRRRKKHLRWMMNENFQDGRDALVTLSFRKGDSQPETLGEMKTRAAGFLRRLRAEYQALGRELKYIYCVEIGPRGARHIHALLSDAGELPMMLLWKCWDGVVDVKPLYTGGQYEDLANYFVKSYAEKTERATGGEMKRCFECSRNLKKPKITVVRIRERDIRKDIEAPEGYSLDRSSVREGVGKVTGWPYRFYRLLRLEAKTPPAAAPAEHIGEKKNTLFDRVRNWFTGWRKRQCNPW